MQTEQGIKPETREKSPEEQYLVAGDACSMPDNCCSEYLWFYCLAGPCVQGLMRQQLIYKDEVDPMSKEHAGSPGTICFIDGCYSFCFPCVTTDQCCKIQNDGVGNNTDADRAVTKQMQHNTRKDIEIGLIMEANPEMANVEHRLHDNMWCGPLYRAGYVITKNRQNEKNRQNKQKAAAKKGNTFYAEFHRPPGTKKIEFLIP